jgi:hypothetical protein
MDPLATNASLLNRLWSGLAEAFSIQAARVTGARGEAARVRLRRSGRLRRLP